MRLEAALLLNRFDKGEKKEIVAEAERQMEVCLYSEYVFISLLLRVEGNSKQTRIHENLCTRVKIYCA